MKTGSLVAVIFGKLGAVWVRLRHLSFLFLSAVFLIRKRFSCNFTSSTQFMNIFVEFFFDIVRRRARAIAIAAASYSSRLAARTGEREIFLARARIPTLPKTHFLQKNVTQRLKSCGILSKTWNISKIKVLILKIIIVEKKVNLKIGHFLVHLFYFKVLIKTYNFAKKIKILILKINLC